MILKKSDLSIVGIVVVAASIGIFMFAKSKIQKEQEISTPIINPIDQKSSSTDPSSRIDQIFVANMIGAEIGYLEGITGPAKSRLNNTNIYEVDGCEVSVSGIGTAIQSIRLAISDSCTFDLNRILTNYDGSFPALNKLTYGGFDAITGGGVFMADCLIGCGNAGDPTIYQYWQGSRADGLTEVLLESKLDELPIIEASEKWSSAMVAANGEEWVSMNRFNCEQHQSDGVAHQEFSAYRVRAITVGQQLTVPGCL